MSGSGFPFTHDGQVLPHPLGIQAYNQHQSLPLSVFLKKEYYYRESFYGEL
jgi:hypothetical protein